MDNRINIESSNILPAVGSIFLILVGCCVLLGWALDISLLKSAAFGFAIMKPNTAVCFLIFGVALWFSKKNLFTNNYRQRITQGCAILVLLIALITLAEYVFNVNPGIDRILFSRQIAAEDDVFPGRMSPVTAFNFFVLSLALLFRNVKIREKFYPAQWLSLIVALTSLIVIIGYAYNVQPLQQAARFAAVPIHTVISFFIISLCFLFIDGDRGITAVFFRKSPGGLLTRRLVPAALIIPIIFGWLRLKGEYAGYYDTEFGLALFTISNIIIFTFLIWRSAFWLDQTDAARQIVQDNLNVSLKNLADMKFALDESAIVAFTDQTGKINFVNDKFCEISGYSREELIGQDHRIINSGFHPKEFIRELWTTIAGGKVWRGELQNRAKDGSLYWVDTTIVPFLDERGKPYQYVAIRNDITNRKQAETALVNMASIVESTADAVISKGFDGKILSWNKAAERIFGYTAEEAVGRDLAILFPLQLLDEEKEILDKIKRGEQIAHFETLRRRKDGSEVEISLTISPVKNENGEIIGISKIAREITEQKRAAEALRESEGKMRLFVEYAPAAVAMFDREMRYLAVSRRWLEDYNLTENLIGRSHYEVFPNISEKWKEFHQNCLAGAVEKVEEDSFIRADGSVGWLKWEILPWFNAADEIGGIIIFSEDITERKRAEKIISDNEKQLRRVLDNLFIFVGLSTPDGTLVEVNRAPLEAAGINVEEALGKKTWETVWVSHSAEVQRQMRKDFEKAAQGEIIRHDVELQVSSGFITIDYMLAPVRDDDGNITHLISSGVDITQRKQYELAFIRLNQSLEQKVAERTAELNSVNKELESFSYSVSHDLRAPLRAMDGFSLALLEDYAEKLDATGQNYLNRVRNASQQMARLIDSMLLLSRVTRSELVKQDVNLSEVARSIAERLQEAQPRENVVFEIEENVRAFGDSRLLRIALENLLGNAYKFTSKRDDAKISFGQTQTGGGTEYFVKDNGAGFDMTYAGKLFGAFQRLHNSTEFEGTGIGLATVQRVVRRHGGSVRAESKIGEGASFYFTV